MTPEEKYQLYMSRKAADQAQDDGLVVTPEANESAYGEGVGEDAIKKRQAQDQAAMDSTARGPKNGQVTAAGDTMMAAGTVGANPYVAGAGLALSTLGKVDDAVRSSEQAKIDAYNKKIMAKRSAIRNMFA